MTDQDATIRVADRYLVRLAVQQVFDSPGTAFRVASLNDFTPAVAEAFMEAFYLPAYSGKVAFGFGSLVRKVKELVRAFTKLPKLWTRFKEMLGVESLLEIPGAIKDMAKQGFVALKRLMNKAFSHWPLKLYTLDKGKLYGLTDLISELVKKHPKFSQWLSKAKGHVDQVSHWLREHAPAVSTVVIVAIYIWIWMNVTEFEWNLKGLLDAISGVVPLSDLLASLPTSGIGFLLKLLGVSSFTLLPITIVARFLYLIGHRYIVWTGRGFALDREALAEDFNILGTELPAMV